MIASSGNTDTSFSDFPAERSYYRSRGVDRITTQYIFMVHSVLQIADVFIICRSDPTGHLIIADEHTEFIMLEGMNAKMIGGNCAVQLELSALILNSNRDSRQLLN